MVSIKRWIVHAFMPPWRWRLAFPESLLNEIESAVKQSERKHRGELRFVIENSLPSSWIWRGMSAHERALDVFSNLRVWDTEENSGVLIYLLLADHEVHIVADRGIAKRVDQSAWNEITKAMRTDFQQGDFRHGSLAGIEKITGLLSLHFPADKDNRNELTDRPAIIKK